MDEYKAKSPNETKTNPESLFTHTNRSDVILS